MNCPCQSGERFDQCCEPFISHQALPENAQQLMRSRYCAYVINNRDYLIQTWHADFQPPELQLDQQIKWLGLEILQFTEQGKDATVEFEALLLVNGKVDAMHEKSQFLREQGQWLYTTGEMMLPTQKPWKPARNSACPCGSGLKFKRCCGR